MRQPAFQAFTVKSTGGRLNRIITDIAVSAAFDPAKPPNTLPKSIDTKALWDTGATRSVVSADLATTLGLAPVGSCNVNHAGGTSVSPTYLVNFSLPHHVGVVGVLVTTFPRQGPNGFGAIIGMDVICHGDLALTNFQGQTWMSFRTPSCAAVDYVVEHRREMFAGVGRNDPCPCGASKPSGGPVKFKHCHGS